MTLEEMLKIEPYSLKKEEKNKILVPIMKELSLYHYENCVEYKKILDSFSINLDDIKNIEDIPFLPIRLFKEYELKSISDDKISRVMTSSGTTGQQVSKIILSLENSKNQQKVLSKIISSYIGEKRLPLLILDSKIAVKDRKLFSARGAGIMGFSIYGKDITYALDENMELNLKEIIEFTEKYKDKPVLMFGYTFMIWKYFYIALKEKNIKLKFSDNSTLFHVGGWKKLKELAVENDIYKESLREQCNINKIYNYYGMAEQLGSIFVECEYGHLHTSIFSDIIARRSSDFNVVNYGEKGLLQVLSVLPKSYPGHSLLTEDEGIIIGEDDCPCGRCGKYFKILGRIKNAELRGCSDTYANRFKNK